MLGLPKGSVIVIPYDDAWPAHYATEASRVWPLIAPFARDIQHVGSTAVPGLAAKPVIDIAIAVDSAEAVVSCFEALASLGYENRLEGMNGPGHHYSIRGPLLRTHQVHTWQLPTYGWNDHLRFRDCLRANPSLAAEYAALKLRLAEEYTADKLGYNLSKTDFVRAVLQSTP